MQTLWELSSDLDIRRRVLYDLKKDFGFETPEDLESWFKEEGHTWEMLISETKLFHGGAELLSNALIGAGYEVPRYTMPNSLSNSLSSVLVPTEKQGQVRLASLRHRVYIVLKSQQGQPLSKYEMAERLGKTHLSGVTRSLNFLMRMEVQGVRCNEDNTLFWWEGETFNEEIAEIEPSLENFTYPDAIELAEQAKQHLEKAKEIASQITDLEQELTDLEQEQRRQEALAKIKLEGARNCQRLINRLAEFGEELPSVSSETSNV